MEQPPKSRLDADRETMTGNLTVLYSPTTATEQHLDRLGLSLDEVVLWGAA